LREVFGTFAADSRRFSPDVTGIIASTNENQSDDNHWSYEFSELVRLLLAEDHAACAAHRTLTLETVRLMEGLRRDAGLVFPGP
jgi:hypothetical protein